MVATYEAAITALPSWDDRQIMTCNLARLMIAITAACEAANKEHEFQAAIHGIKIPEKAQPAPRPKTVEEFNENARDAMRFLCQWNGVAAP